MGTSPTGSPQTFARAEVSAPTVVLSTVLK